MFVGVFRNRYSLGILMALMINFVVEAFSRHSIRAALFFMWQSPAIFLYNALLILATLCLVLLVKRKVAMLTFLTLFWGSLGAVNSLILAHRVTPLTFQDILVVFDIITIVPRYFTIPQVTFLAVAVITLLAGLFLVIKKAPLDTARSNYRRGFSILSAMALSLVVLTQLAHGSGLLPRHFGNLAQAYQDYGFAYAFSTSIFSVGIPKPAGYGEAAVASLGGPLEGEDGSFLEGVLENGGEFPNIIMVQLESFFDPEYLEGVEFSQDPIPNFRALRDGFSSGFLTVPVVGAGTVNTEFEVLTGMSIQFFGPGEIPYKTVLGHTPVESLPHNLRPLGYTSHAIHNNTGTFYNRHNVFSSMGFDTFTSSEFMDIGEVTEIGWPTDRLLVDPIFSALNATEGPDFLFVISVQSHGDYPSSYELEPTVRATGFADPNRQQAFEFYLSMIHEVDVFIGELVGRSEEFPEDTVLVLYGDHLPTFYFQASDLANHDIYQTEFVMWNNFGLPNVDQDLYAYQLSSFILRRLGIHHGTLPNFHRDYKDGPDYLEQFKLLQYDMLYGQRYLYGTHAPPTFSDLQMGILPITVSGVYNDRDGNLIVTGENFTQASRIFIDGHRYDTEFLSPAELMLKDREIGEGETLVVKQVNAFGKVLSVAKEANP
ncbi:MAG: LTA synthase family protein [Turicibacter sp.]|nr:LTA synthase family protein [Turicibacter sp.]